MAGQVMAYVISMERHMKWSNEGINSCEVRLSLIDISYDKSMGIHGVVVILFSIGWMTNIISSKLIDGREIIWKVNVHGR